ncbi:MAG: cysteine desulfurase [Thermus sp.]|uniref:cysteine desulfurase family protein n=1 Tax=unclassified Thermus TaxID=2619321 RepID=UPI0002389419|nr:MULTISPECIES: cysteine desulfurase family protein [unclassified Thermus]AEV16721.1 Aminotransferase class V [Thermus sp. CCB_US3_UF1]MCS6867369.1 cysteine desulfurase [Thermus sp.]MCS7219114.1 cysteine desulfurase [Thermus sp.]MCX7850660.1 cysteine desulfurase [Thermus sp.]MDW8356455.1 cysteine desulfurase family protein [Thermus sp.]
MRVYLDHAATTPLDPEVREAMRGVEEAFGNPSSVHRFGQEARRVLEGARERIAALLGVRPREVVFTASGSEANALALLGVALAKGRGHVVSTEVEHAAVLGALRLLERLGFAVTRLKPDRFGLVYPEQVAEALRPDTVLVSVMAANNELGTLYPVDEIAQVVHAHGALFHTDAVQAIGQVPFRAEEVGADLVSLSAHKFYGPKGVGALLVRQGVDLVPLVPGKQEGGRRGGTPNPVLAHGMAVALEKALRLLPEEAPRLLALRRRLEEGLLSVEGVELNGHPERRLPKLVNVTVKGADGEVLLLALDLLGVAASSGSACSAGSLEASHVLLALGRSPEEAKASLRFSLGRFTTLAEVEGAVAAFREAVARARS